MILFSYVIKQLHISLFKFQSFLGWCFVTPSKTTALGSTHTKHHKYRFAHAVMTNA